MYHFLSTLHPQTFWRISDWMVGHPIQFGKTSFCINYLDSWRNRNLLQDISGTSRKLLGTRYIIVWFMIILLITSNCTGSTSQTMTIHYNVVDSANRSLQNVATFMRAMQVLVSHERHNVREMISARGVLLKARSSNDGLRFHRTSPSLNLFIKDSPCFCIILNWLTARSLVFKSHDRMPLQNDFKDITKDEGTRTNICKQLHY